MRDATEVWVVNEPEQAGLLQFTQWLGEEIVRFVKPAYG